VDFVDEQVGAPFDRAAVAQIQPADGEAGHRQQPDQPGMCQPRARGPVQGEQESGRSGAGQDGHGSGDQQPFQEMQQ